MTMLKSGNRTQKSYIKTFTKIHEVCNKKALIAGVLRVEWKKRTINMKYALVQERPYLRKNCAPMIESRTDLPTRLVEIAISDSFDSLEKIIKLNKSLSDCRIIER